jgi:hypothetical protein
MGLLNYTTKIDADKTASEITKCLSAHGASAILTDYQDGVLSAISFQITVNEQKISFRLPCDWRPVLGVLMKDVRVPAYSQRYAAIKRDREMQAVRTAWRIVKDWVEAQMALVETQMVTTRDVFLPYAVMRDGRTLAQHVQTNPGFLLGPSTDDV